MSTNTSQDRRPIVDRWERRNGDADAAWRRSLDRSGPRNLPPPTDELDLQLIVDCQDGEPRRRVPSTGRHAPRKPLDIHNNAVAA